MLINNTKLWILTIVRCVLNNFKNNVKQSTNNQNSISCFSQSYFPIAYIDVRRKILNYQVPISFLSYMLSFFVSRLKKVSKFNKKFYKFLYAVTCILNFMN